MARYTGQGTILGGLPVIVDIGYGTYNSPATGREDYANVDAIYWLKRNGAAGKPIPQKVWDRAEKYDPYFSHLIEQVFDNAHDPSDDLSEMVQLT